MTCELCGTTIPVRRKYEQIINVNLSPYRQYCVFNVHFVINIHIDHESNFLRQQEAQKVTENDTSVLLLLPAIV